MTLASPVDPKASLTPATKVLLALLIGVNSVSIFGYATFGLHPALLSQVPGAPEIFAVAYPFFARLQIALAFLVLAVALTQRLGTRWFLSFVTVFVLSAGSELAGTSLGIPFGKYEYTALLGPRLFDKVPILIPLSWYTMALPAYALVARWPSAVARVTLGSILLLCWDLTLDPAMSYLTPFWIWEKTGAYYGMPASNLFGWFVTGVALMGAFEVVRVRAFVGEISERFYLKYYLANLMLPVGMAVAAGLWLSIFVTIAAALVFFALHHYVSRRA